jgi:DNA-binding transcriptional LysR family regulator
LVAIVPRTHELAVQKHVGFEAVARGNFVGLPSGALQTFVDLQATKTGVSLTTRVRMPTFEGVCRMVASGVGFGIVPETIARRCQRSMKIASVRLTDGWATRRLVVCVRDAGDLAPPARELFDYLGSSGNDPPSRL